MEKIKNFITRNIKFISCLLIAMAIAISLTTIYVVITPQTQTNNKEEAAIQQPPSPVKRGEKYIPSLKASLNEGVTLYTDTELDNSMFNVELFSGDKTEAVTGFTLSGELTSPEAEILISYNGYNTYIKVAVSEAPVEIQTSQTEEIIVSSPEPVATAGKMVYGVPMIYQNAEGLPGGCEATSLTMCLQYIGIPISAYDTYMYYMPHSWDTTDIENIFIGDATCGGYGVYVGGVITTANNVLAAYGSGASVYNHTGDLAGMYAEIDNGYPVVIWGTDGWGDPNWGTYYSNAGAFEWWSNEHCLCLVGYSDTTVTIHDPYRGVVEIDRGWFEYEWANCGSRAVAVH